MRRQSIRSQIRAARREIAQLHFWVICCGESLQEFISEPRSPNCRAPRGYVVAEGPLAAASPQTPWLGGNDSALRLVTCWRALLVVLRPDSQSAALSIVVRSLCVVARSGHTIIDPPRRPKARWSVSITNF